MVAKTIACAGRSESSLRAMQLERAVDVAVGIGPVAFVDRDRARARHDDRLTAPGTKALRLTPSSSRARACSGAPEQSQTGSLGRAGDRPERAAVDVERIRARGSLDAAREPVLGHERVEQRDRRPERRAVRQRSVVVAAARHLDPLADGLVALAR